MLYLIIANAGQNKAESAWLSHLDSIDDNDDVFQTIEGRPDVGPLGEFVISIHLSIQTTPL